MGKLKKNSRNSRLRRQKLAAGVKQDGDSVSETKRVLPLLQKLSSTSPNDRSMALSTITLLCEDPNLRRIFLKEKLVKIVLEQCINDNNDEIVVESFGLLRNLVIDEGVSLIKHLLRSNLWFLIEHNINTKCKNSFHYLFGNNDNDSGNNNSGNNKPVTVKTDEINQLFDFTETLISLVLSILTCSDDEIFVQYYQKLNEGEILNFIVDLINLNLNSNSLKFSKKLFQALLEFIYQLSNQSSDFVLKIVPLISLTKLLQFDENFTILSRLSHIYIQGIKFHYTELTDESITNRDEFILATLRSITSIISTINIEESLKLLNKPIDNTEPNNATKEEENNKELSTINDELLSIDISLDIIATLIEFNGSENYEESISLNQDLMQFYISSLIPMIIQLFTNYNEYFTNKVLIVLNNLSWLFSQADEKPVEWFESAQKLYEIVITKFLLLEDYKNDLALVTDYLNALFILGKTLHHTLPFNLNKEQLDKILKLSNSVIDISTDESQAEAEEEEPQLIKQFFIALISFLAIIAKVPSQLEITSIISDYIFQLIKFSMESLTIDQQHQNNKLFKHLKQNYIFELIITEAINSIFDIYDDKTNDYDYQLFVAGGLNNTLKIFEKEFKSIYKKIDKNKDEILKSKSEETAINLGRFIQYKEDEAS